MFQAIGSVKKISMLLPLLALWSCAAVSQPSGDNSKALAERAIRANNGVAAIVFNEKGDPIVVTKEGLRIPSCQVCSPELERKWGPQCAKARKVSEAPAGAVSSSEEPLICNKLMGTNVQGIKPISVLRHTGSNCITIAFDNGGISEVFDICW